ncbi:hypothetical protein ACEPAH_9262 [Sanghuangporus vaninii]
MSTSNLDVVHIVAAAESDDAAALQELITILRNIDIAKVYDWFLTLDEEVFLVWPSRFGLPKVLFFINRYFPFIDLAFLTYVQMAGSDPSLCVILFQTLGGTMAFGFVIAQLVLSMRTWAIWARTKWMTILLVILLLSALGVDVFVLHRYLGGVSYSPLGPFESVFQGCLLHFDNRFVFIDFVLIMIIESTMLVLLVAKALEHFKQSRSTLMVQMFKDGVIYFIFILITSVANVIVIITAPIELHNFLIVTQRILHSIFCSRVLLHIRGAYTNTAFSSTTTGSSQHHIQSGGHFAFRRQTISTIDSLTGRSYGYGYRGIGRRGLERDTDTFELTSVDVQSPTSPTDCGDEAPVIKGWGLGQGYDCTPPVSDDSAKYREWEDLPEMESANHRDRSRERAVFQGNITDLPTTF